MKFTDGYWQMRPGVTPHYPVHVHRVNVEPAALTVYGPTKRLTHRGDTLNLPLLTVRLSSPMPNIIRVQLYHHKGTRPRKPEFELGAGQAADVEIRNDAQAATLTSGRLTVRVEKAGDWHIAFKDGERALTHRGPGRGRDQGPGAGRLEQRKQPTPSPTPLPISRLQPSHTATPTNTPTPPANPPTHHVTAEAGYAGAN